MLLRFVREDDGSTAMEYGLIASLVAVVCMASVNGVAIALRATFVYWSSNM